MVTVLFYGTSTGATRLYTAVLASDDAEVNIAVFSKTSVPARPGNLHAHSLFLNVEYIQFKRRI